MRRSNLADYPEAILEALNDSDFGGESDEDENWFPPGTESERDSGDEEPDQNASAPVITTPATNNTWTRRAFRSKPIPSVASDDYQEV